MRVSQYRCIEIETDDEVVFQFQCHGGHGVNVYVGRYTTGDVFVWEGGEDYFTMGSADGREVTPPNAVFRAVCEEYVTDEVASMEDDV